MRTAERIDPWWFTAPVVACIVVGCAEGADTREYAGTSGSGGSTSAAGGAGVGADAASESDGPHDAAAGSGSCASLSCTSPPAPVCADDSHLTVFDSPGACDAGACVYASHDIYCQFGCDEGICNGDACLGITCNTPPANACSGPDKLTVYETPGICKSGACTYNFHDEFCAHGCNANQCVGDPCIGITCLTPPSDYCVDSNTLRRHDALGSCAGGTCSYAHQDVDCPFGCDAGVCRDCSQDQDCGSGMWCDLDTCVPCSADQHCGSSCQDCSSTAQVCQNGACVDCYADGHCGPGRWCDGSSCRDCNTNDHCGSACTACSGETPSCSGSACQCSPSSCGTNHLCVGGACEVCASDDACGAACTPCVAPKPRCLSQGATSQCVACVTSADCTGTDVCIGNTCGVACPQPTEACNTGGQSRSGCTNARVIGRVEASSPSGYFVSTNTCNASDASHGPDSSSCWDYGRDHSYRIFLRAGESMTAAITKGSKCSSATSWDRVLKIYAGTGCDDRSCSSKLVCKSMGGGTLVESFTAPYDAWYVLVIDGRTSAYDDSGSYTLTVNMTCATSGCGC